MICLRKVYNNITMMYAFYAVVAPRNRLLRIIQRREVRIVDIRFISRTNYY